MLHFAPLNDLPSLAVERVTLNLSPISFNSFCLALDCEARIILPDEKPNIQDVELYYDYVVVCTGCVKSSCLDNNKLEVLPELEPHLETHTKSWLFTSDKNKMIAITNRYPSAIERATNLYDFMKTIDHTENCIAFDGAAEEEDCEDYEDYCIRLYTALKYGPRIKNLESIML